MTKLEVTVGGEWVSTTSLLGDVQTSTVWPGGSGEVSWVESDPTRTRRRRGGQTVKGYLGPVCVWSGTLLEPDPSQDRMVAEGLWRAGDGFVALDGSGNATTTPDTAIDQAISRGLQWTRPVSISSSAVDLDVSQGPVGLNALLDSWTEQSGQRWGVNPAGEVYAKADDTGPTYQVFPLEQGLGYALDTYASTLIGRYQTSGGYATATRTNTDAEALHGHTEAVVDLTPRGVLTATKANNILDNMLALGRAVPQWTAGVQVTYGELLTFGGTPVALEAVAAGKVLRIHGGFDLAWRLQGAMYLDMQIGETNLADGTLLLKPQGLAARNLQDVLTAALTKR